MTMKMQVLALENKGKVSFIENKILKFLPKKLYFSESRHISLPIAARSARCDDMDLLIYCILQLTDYDV